MYQQFRDIIADLPSTTTLYLSNFTPLELFKASQEQDLKIKLLPSTLQGLIDVRSIKAFDLDEDAVIIAWPFFHISDHNDALKEMQESHNFQLFTIEPKPIFHLQEIQQIFKDALSSSVDLDTGPITTSDSFIIYLRPHLFCPKEGIVDALKSKDVKFYTQLDALYKQKCFEKEKRFHMAARECSLSFIALDCHISKESAHKSAQIILQTLEQHALRRCSF